MNKYVEGKSSVIEIGAGMGLSREFIRNPNLLLTDVTGYPWIDMKVDALNLPFEEESVDVCVCSHTIHHMSSPAAFFEAIHRILKPRGMLLIQELEASCLLRLLQRLVKNEGWSYRVDVFDRDAPCIPAGTDHWAGNTAIANLLFSSPGKFEKEIEGFKVIHNELNECLVFALSGGVLVKVPSLTLPYSWLRLADKIDERVISWLPKVFALGRRVVLEKR